MTPAAGAGREEVAGREEPAGCEEPAVAEDGGDLRGAAWYDLMLATHMLETALERQAQRDGGISHGQFKLLVLLSGAEAQTLGLTSLAATLRFSPSRISHALKALERLGLVTRRPVSGGRRAYEATLTDDGRDLVARVLRGQRAEITEPLLTGLGERRTAALGEISARMIELLDASSADAGTGTGSNGN